MPNPEKYERTPPRDSLCYNCWQYGRSVPIRPGECRVCGHDNGYEEVEIIDLPDEEDDTEIIYEL